MYQILEWLVLLIGGIAAVLFIAITLQRYVAAYQEERVETKLAELRPKFIKYLLGETGHDELVEAIGGSRTVAEDILLDLLRDLQGTEREKLTRLAQSLKMIKHHHRDLTDFDWHKREMAAMRLGIYSLDESVPHLMKRLKDRVLQVRYTAARSLGIIDSPAAVEALVAILDRPELVDAPRILEIVQNMESRMTEPLKRMLTDENHSEVTKLLAIDLVGDLRDTSLISELHNVLQSTKKEQVIRALKAVAKIASPQSAGEILRLANDREWEIRAQAMKAIGSVRLQNGLEELEGGLSDEAYWVRHNAAEALLALGEDGFHVLLTTYDASSDRFAKDIAAYQLELSNGRLSPHVAAEATGATP